MAKMVTIGWNAKMERYTAECEGDLYSSPRHSAISARIWKEHRRRTRLDRAARNHFSENLPPVR